MTKAGLRVTVGAVLMTGLVMLRCFRAILALLGALVATAAAAAQDAPRSECLAMANAAPRATPVGLRSADAKTDEVAITYAGHSTYYIDTPGGVRIATDFSGAYTTGRLPDVVTMNRAHSTHYTLFPDPRIPHVLHGWGDDGQPAKIADAHRRRLHPQRHHRHPPLFRRRFQRRDDQGRQLDLHLRGRRPLHRPSRPPASQARRQPFRGDRPARYRDGADRRHLYDVARRHFGHHAALARLGGAADASFHDPARRIHAQDRPAIRHRHADRADADDFAARHCHRRRR